MRKFNILDYTTKASCILLVLLSISIISCKKFLDEKPLKSDVVPSTLNDLQAILDNAVFAMNFRGLSLGDFMSDNTYVTTADYNAQAANVTTGFYIWQMESDLGTNLMNSLYTGPIYYSNVVLDQLPNINSGAVEAPQRNYIEGAALFYRAFNFYELAQVYCKPYSASASVDPGVILKLSSNINEKTDRGTVQKTYDQIISDLKKAADLLPPTVNFPTQPNRVAAYAMLARTFLSMGKYSEAGIYADLALQLNHNLMDYNTLVPIGSPPIKSYNKEMIFANVAAPQFLNNPARGAKIDSTLYRSYDANDLRKKVFFLANTGIAAGTFRFQGSYMGNYAPTTIFDGLSTSELYLIRSECNAKDNKVTEAMNDLNTLMVTRWDKNVVFVPFTASNASDALQKIRLERRKELIYRSQRWTDLRRYNVEGANITLTRIINGKIYTLPPNDNRWVCLIPQREVDRGVPQNPR